MPSARTVNLPSQAFPQIGATHQQLTIDDEYTLTGAPPGFSWNSGTQHVMVQVNDAPIRITSNVAQEPTSTIGFVMEAGSVAFWSIDFAKKVKAIPDGAGAATLELQEFNHR